MISLKSVRAFIFDLNDTFYDESMFVQRGTNTVLKWLAERYDPDSNLLRDEMAFISKAYPRNEWYQKLLAKVAVSCLEELVNEMIYIYRNHPAELKLFPDADRFLRRLRKRKEILIGLITDGDVSVEKSKVANLGLDKKFHISIFTWCKGMEYQKPHPWAFELVEERLGISGKACCYFGNDPAKNFLTPNKLGWVTVHVCRETHRRITHADKACHAQYTLRSFDGID